MASEHVPGTVHLVDVAGQQASAKSVNGIELIPRPSDDPEDPLNWSPRRKRLNVIMVCVYTNFIGFAITLPYSVLADITAETGISTAALVQGTGLMFLFLGWGCLIWQPIARTYGRRGVYVISMLSLVPLMVWTAYSNTEGEWYAHRILLGLFGAPVESLPEVSIPDVFFAHDRGTWMSIYVFVLFGSNFLAPLIAGWFSQAFGWRWTMNLGAITSAASFLILYFFLEETMYFRNTLEGLEEEADNRKPIASALADAGIGRTGAADIEVERPVASSDEKAAEDQTQDQKQTESPQTQSDAAEPPPAAAAQQVYGGRRTYREKLRLFERMPGSQSVGNMFKAMYLPLYIIVTFPNVAWAGFIYGVNLSWYNVLNGTASPILSAPPYNWSTGLVGCIYVGPIIGAGLGSLWSGVVADRFTLWLARRNGGIREPEQRTWPLLLAALTSCGGLILWGVGASRDIHWMGLAIGSILMVTSCVTGGSIALSYNVDCFKDISGESTTSIIIIRNTLGFAVSYGITPWYTNMGLQNCFIMAGFLSLGCTLTFLFMIWKGKALRKRSAPRYWRLAAQAIKHE